MTASQFLTIWLQSLAAFTWGNLVMVLVGLLLLALGLSRWKLPLLVPLGIGCLLVNLAPPSLAGFFQPLVDLGVISGLLPVLALVALGASVDFIPLLTRPRVILPDGLLQVGVFIVLFIALGLGLPVKESAAMTAAGTGNGIAVVFAAARLAPNLLASAALAAYLYACWMPGLRRILQRLLVPVTYRETEPQPSTPLVSRRAAIFFPILITLGVGIFFPGAAVLVGAFMLGNLLRISGLLDNLGANVVGPAYRLILFFVVLGVGATMTPASFLTAATVRTLVFTLIALLLNGLVWVYGAPRAYRWAGVQPRDGQESMLASLLAVGVLLGIASFIP